MAKNVSYQSSTKDGQNSGAQHTASQNNAFKSYFQRKNNFPMNYLNLQTARYGDIQPFYVFNGIPADVVPLRSEHEIRSYTLQSPMLSGINMHKDFYLVPMKAILPRTFDLIYTNPTQGDDVPEDAYCSVNLIMFLAGLQQFSLPALRDNTSVSNSIDKLEVLLKFTWLIESITSAGSLGATLGGSLNSVVSSDDDENGNIDSYIDTVIKELFLSIPIGVTFGSQDIYTVSENPIDLSDISLSPYKIPLHRMVEMMRESSFSIVYAIDSNWDGTVAPAAISDTDASDLINNAVISLITDVMSNIPTGVENNKYDLSRLLAYQLCCAHFFTNDHVDFIYSADLYRKNAQSIFKQISSLPFFEYNGVDIQYDVFSEKCFNTVTAALVQSSMSANAATNDYFNDALDFMKLIFGFRKSLKYGDYFTGARPQPLAVGDVSVPVVDDSVSAIDITRNISRQRFLNAVNRFGRKFGDYVKGMFDVETPPVDTDPKFISHENFDVTGFEVENTGSAQIDNANSVTTLLKSRNGRYVFEVYCDTPCIILGLQSYDVSRIYCNAVERFFYHKDRFDMFNKFMQYIGDQEVKAGELDSRKSADLPVSYQLRYMEYKQRFNIASGGFVRNLPSWAFVTDNKEAGHPDFANLTPDFIRSSNVELDRFYTSLSGVSLASYFHFIVKFTNISTPSREMEYAPSIL